MVAANTTRPSMTSAGTGIIDVVYKGNDNSLQWKNWNGTLWIDGVDEIGQMPTLLGKDPTIISVAGNRTVFIQLQNGTQLELGGGCMASNLPPYLL